MSIDAGTRESAYTITREEFDALPLDARGAIEEELRQEWRTPPELWAKLNDEFAFDIDVAASEHNALCPHYISRAKDGLKSNWFTFGSRAAYCNPGFSDGESWIRRAYEQVCANRGTVAVVIGIASIGSEWFRFAAEHATEIRLLSPRVQFAPARPDLIRRSSNPNEIAAYVFRGGRPKGPAHITLQRWSS